MPMRLRPIGFFLVAFALLSMDGASQARDLVKSQIGVNNDGQPRQAIIPQPGDPKFSAAPAEDKTPNDPAFKYGWQWNYKPLPGGMNAVGAWQKTTGSKEVVVAVLSSGILPQHPDIAGSPNLLPGYSFVTLDGEQRKPDATDPGDCSAQQKAWFPGTHNAGTIGAVGTNNDTAIAGLNWTVSVLPIRVISKCGQVNYNDLSSAILWAAGYTVEGLPANDHPANIIMVDFVWAGECANDEWRGIIDIIAAARSKGSVVVVPAGDSAADAKGFSPGSCPGVISVGASDGPGHIASYSNYGNVSLMAPGGDAKTFDGAGQKAYIWGVGRPDPQNKNMLWGLTGTPMAAAHVSGALALALAQHPEWRGNADLIEQKLKACAVTAPAALCPNGCGAGKLDAAKLVDCSAAAVASSPSDRAASTPQKAASAAEENPLTGDWLLPDGNGILVIGGKGEWQHPVYGAGRVREATDEADIKVFYDNGGIRCSYRTGFTDGGKTLVLSAVDKSQDASYCPSGELRSATR